MKNDKNKTIDIMINLLKIAKIQPLFSISFYIVAPTENIEQYLIEHTITEDWDGNKLSNGEIELNKRQSLYNFYNSSFYNPNGESGLIFTQTFTLQDIKYDDIYEIVSGKNLSLPKGYKFICLEKTNYYDVKAIEREIENYENI